jgi:uncharacterized membrane protein
MDNIQPITDPGIAFVALVVTLAFLGVGVVIALKLKDEHITGQSIAGAFLLLAGLAAWRAFAPFILPALSIQAQAAVAGIHTAVGLLLTIFVRFLVKRQVKAGLKKAQEETKAAAIKAVQVVLQQYGDDNLPGPEFSTELFQAINNPEQFIKQDQAE